MFQTPDLSQEFHPTPKQYKTKKPPKKLGAGQKTHEWQEIRSDLKEEFAAKGIKTCEAHFKNCWIDNALSFAHKDKRRNLTKEDLRDCALLCVPCHSKIEILPHAEMKKIIEDIISKRIPK